jgi:uncharacterized protein YkwD
MVLKYVATALTATMLAVVAVLGATAAEPQRAEAAVGVQVAACDGGSVDLSAEEKKMLDLHNKIRAERDLPKFCVHPDLQRAARVHSKEMIAEGRFAHGNVGERLRKFGYRWSTSGENIAGGSGPYRTPENRFKAWMNSSGHRANILDKNFREIGIAAYTGTYKSYSNWTMWTADFGAR